jgi:YD repeat-containing protein
VKLCYASTAWKSPPPDTYNNTVQYSGTAQSLQSVVLPNGTAWTFTYDISGLGDLAQITFPTGGSISYTWGVLPLCYPLISKFVGDYTSESLVVASRTVNANDGTGPHVWNYNWGSDVSNGSSIYRLATLTDPLGNQTVYTETGLGNSCSYMETQRVHYQGSQSGGSILKTVSTSYTYSPNTQPFSIESSLSVFNIVPLSITTTLSNGKQSKVTNSFDSGFSYAYHVIPGESYNSPSYNGKYGKMLTKGEYDYGSGAPGPLLRNTITNYLAFSNSTYLAANLLALASSVQVKDVVLPANLDSQGLRI